MHVLGVAGSLRQDSYNRRLLRSAQDLLPAGFGFRLLGGLASVPPYNEDVDGKGAPAAVGRLRTAISRSQWLIIATPEYNGSVPGVLKNALDWASRPFPDNCLRDKPALVIGASSGYFGAAWAQADLRRILKVAGARVIDQQISPVRAEYDFDELGQLVSETVKADVSAALKLLLAEARAA
jgi:chromate reductase